MRWCTLAVLSLFVAQIVTENRVAGQAEQSPPPAANRPADSNATTASQPAPSAGRANRQEDHRGDPNGGKADGASSAASQKAGEGGLASEESLARFGQVL